MYINPGIDLVLDRYLVVFYAFLRDLRGVFMLLCRELL